MCNHGTRERAMNECEYCDHFPTLIESDNGQGDIDVCGCCYSVGMEGEYEAELIAICASRYGAEAVDSQLAERAEGIEQ